LMQKDFSNTENSREDSKSEVSIPPTTHGTHSDTTPVGETLNPPPLVICVPPPRGSLVSARVFFSGLLLLGGALSWTAGGKMHWAFLVLIALVWIGLLNLEMWRSYRRNQRIERFRLRHAAWLDQPAAARLDRLWYFASRPPSVKKIEEALWHEKAAPLDRAVIVSLSALEAPAPGEYRLEPIVIKPAGGRWARAVIPFALGGALVLGAIFLQQIGVVENLPHYFGVYAIVAAALAAIVWDRLARPRYLRVAPGSVQFLRDASPKVRPTIRDYSLTAGTLVVIRQKGAALELTLRRAAATDSATIGRAACGEDRWGDIFRALVSTAPAPQPSDEELIG
jgi:hypothetical protein